VNFFHPGDEFFNKSIVKNWWVLLGKWILVYSIDNGMKLEPKGKEIQENILTIEKGLI